jgi:hypothetical protein
LIDTCKMNIKLLTTNFTSFYFSSSPIRPRQTRYIIALLRAKIAAWFIPGWSYIYLFFTSSTIRFHTVIIPQLQLVA